jgi:hypothetical protein
LQGNKAKKPQQRLFRKERNAMKTYKVVYTKKRKMSMPWWLEGLVFAGCMASGVIFLYIVAGR